MRHPRLAAPCSKAGEGGTKPNLSGPTAARLSQNLGDLSGIYWEIPCVLKLFKIDMKIRILSRQYDVKKNVSNKIRYGIRMYTTQIVLNMSNFS